MISPPSWLPDLLLLADCDDDWQRYEDEVYSIFYTDFIESHPHVENTSVHIAKQLIDGKERTFWHCIQEGQIEDLRKPDLRRCERIRWIRAILENANNPSIKRWQTQKGRHIRQLLWLESAEFLVVLEKRKTDWLLWTAYCTTWPHTKRKLRQEYDASSK
jgi:hypothetical protein